jgi:hypothetical protein
VSSASEVSTGWLPWLGVGLTHGPWAAFETAFAISPGIPILLARILERRWLRPGEQFVAFIYGDPLLAVAVGTGIELTHGSAPAAVRGLTGGGGAVGIAAGLLAFGLVCRPPCAQHPPSRFRRTGTDRGPHPRNRRPAPGRSRP